MSKEILSLVEVLAKEKSLDKEIVFESLEKALSFATKRSFEGEFPEIDVFIDRATGKYRTVRKWTIVTDVDFYDDDKELSESDIAENPERFGANLKVGDIVEEELENVDLGRVSAQSARNIIAQKIKDAEREAVLKEYLSRNNGIIFGKVKKFERGNVIVDCGRIEAMIMRNDQIDKELLQPGNVVKGYFDKEAPVIKNGRLLISRSSNEFLAKLLEHNVPELASGRVLVKAIARDAGNRAKVAVLSLDARIDAKGAVIGFRNQRIDSVTSELSGEKIDIVDYNEDLAQFTLNALAPAEIDSIVVDEEKRVVEVIVEDDKLGAAIGSDGINVRLASKLIGCVINVYGKTEAKDKHAQTKNDLIKMFNDALDIDDDISELLVSHNFTSLEEVAYVDLEELLEIEDFDEDVAQELQQRAKDKLLSKNIVYKDKMDKLSSELSTIVKLSSDVLLQLAESGVLSLDDFAELSGDELMDLISIDLDTANTLIMKAREACGWFKE